MSFAWLTAETKNSSLYSDLKATHVSRVASILEAILIALHEKLEKKSVHKHQPDSLCLLKSNIICKK